MPWEPTGRATGSAHGTGCAAFIEPACLNRRCPFGLSLSKPCAALRRTQRERFKQVRTESITCRPARPLSCVPARYALSCLQNSPAKPPHQSRSAGPKKSPGFRQKLGLIPRYLWDLRTNQTVSERNGRAKVDKRPTQLPPQRLRMPSTPKPPSAHIGTRCDGGGKASIDARTCSG